MKAKKIPRKAFAYLTGTILSLFAAFLIYTGCITTTEEIPTTLEVSKQSLNFSYSGAEDNFTVTSNYKWTVTKDASWLIVSPSSGSDNGTVTVVAEQNTNANAEPRTATITVGNGIPNKEQTISVTQEGTPLNDFTENINGQSIAMIFVQGGTFTMGCTAEQGGDCYDDETPTHQVTLSDFYIGKYEVTQGQLKAVMGNNPSYFPKGDNYPVESVSWEDIVGTSGATMVIKNITYYANGFIYKLNQLTGKQYRLPTEAEWEYAARGGNKSGSYKYSGSNSVDNVAWYRDNLPSQSSGNSGYGTQPVGTKASNELGVYDMSGNVWEWCSDWFGDYSGNAQTNPIGPSLGSYRVFRGGSWGSIAFFARVSVRSSWFPGYRSYSRGFRLTCSSN